MSVTWPKDMGGLEALAVFYSYVPWVIGFWSFLSLVVRRGTRELNFMLFTGFTVICAEVILKNVLSQDRPPRSCNTTCGMPSSHATLAVGFLSLRVFDVLLRARPRDHPVHASSFQACEQEGEGAASSAAEQIFSVLPVASANEHTIMGHLFRLLLWALLLAPVTWSRLVVNDHYPSQVIDGSILGFSLAVLWWTCSLMVQRKYNHRLGCPALTWRNRTLLWHDHALPCCMAIARCAAGPRDDATETLPSPGPFEELSWYVWQAERRERELRRGCASSLAAAEVEFCRGRAMKLRELARLAKERRSRPRSSLQETTTSMEADSQSGQPDFAENQLAVGNLTSPMALSDHLLRRTRTSETSGSEGRVGFLEHLERSRAGTMDPSVQSFEVQSFVVDRQCSREEGRGFFFQGDKQGSTKELREDHGQSFSEVESLPSRSFEPE